MNSHPCYSKRTTGLQDQRIWTSPEFRNPMAKSRTPNGLAGWGRGRAEAWRPGLHAEKTTTPCRLEAKSNQDRLPYFKNTPGDGQQKDVI